MVSDTQNGAWFSDSRNTSDSYINGRYDSDYDNNTYSVFLNIRNPLYVDYSGKGALDEGNEAPSYWLENSHGYDGIICSNIKDRGDYLGGYAEQDENGNFTDFYDDNVYGYVAMHPSMYVDPYGEYIVRKIFERHSTMLPTLEFIIWLDVEWGCDDKGMPQMRDDGPHSGHSILKTLERLRKWRITPADAPESRILKGKDGKAKEWRCIILNFGIHREPSKADKIFGKVLNEVASFGLGKILKHSKKGRKLIRPGDWIQVSSYTASIDLLSCARCEKCGANNQIVLDEEDADWRLTIKEFSENEKITKGFEWRSK